MRLTSISYITFVIYILITDAALTSSQPGTSFATMTNETSTSLQGIPPQQLDPALAKGRLTTVYDFIHIDYGKSISCVTA